ncbi:helix-turn-helix domain-containing protein [Staphylococcus cornubiensis]|uniref:helix-turn-helix domain-containing protein n=1 Tax=Staphylococcus cornubiensis TaxID=1986155 RepID=UPI000A375877|nr:helix-turn-helix domain-containing protein [Staphylococcus cornubiensis]
MQGITIELMKQHTSTAYRVFNRVELFVSFEGVLTLELNGKKRHFYHQVAIVNHNDIVKVKDAQAVAKISIPLHYFSEYQPHYLLGYFNQERLSSHNKMTSQIKKVITENDEEKYFEVFLPIIETLVNECFIETGTIYIPQIQVKSILFKNIMDYVHQKPLSRLSLPELSEHFFVSESYISTLFNRYLNYTFKKYFVSLKVGLSIYYLLNTNESINDIALHFQFSSYNHYSKQFKRFTGFSPIAFRKQHQNKVIQVNIKPFDHQYFEGHLLDYEENTNSQQLISIYLNQPQQTRMIHSKVLLLEIKQMREMMQIFNTTDDDMMTKANPVTLYFNPESHTYITFENLDEVARLSELVQKQFGIAYRITSMQSYETFKSHFLQPLLEVLRQSPTAFDMSQLKFNLVLDHATLLARDLKFIVREMKTLLNRCQFTLLMYIPLNQRALQHGIDFDYYMIDMIRVSRMSQRNASSLQSEHPFHRQLKVWLDDNNLNQHPILLSGVSEWLSEQSEDKTLTGQWLDIWLNMHHTVKGLSIPLMSQSPKINGYFNALGHQTALQHIFRLIQPFNHSHSVIGQSYVIHESPFAYDILLFHPFHAQNLTDQLTYELYGTLELHQHFVAEYTYHPKYSNIDYILADNAKGYYLPPHFVSTIHSSNQLLFNLQLHHFGQSRYNTTLASDAIKLIHIAKTQAQQQSDML